MTGADITPAMTPDAWAVGRWNNRRTGVMYYYSIPFLPLLNGGGWMVVFCAFPISSVPFYLSVVPAILFLISVVVVCLLCG